MAARGTKQGLGSPAVRSLWVLVAAILSLWPENSIATLSAADKTLTRTIVSDHYAWNWRGRVGPKAEVRIDLIRAEVIIQRSTSREMRMSAVSIGDYGEAEAVHLKFDETPTGFRLMDIFPRRYAGRAMHECLPPVGERGDYWQNATRFRVVLVLPPDVEVSGHVMEGEILDLRARTPIPASSRR